MDIKALEYTRAHYDKHSNQYASTEDALKARASGPGAPLKKFHNDIKRQLINRFAGGADSLLDFACGRGGDIWKWIDAGIPTVKGIDLSRGEIEEARMRFAEAREKRPGQQLDYEFVDSPALGVQEWREARQYDAVTCMFAIHYFFVTEQALKQFLHNVAINLKGGGYFFGTVPDGKRVNACIKKGKTYRTPMLTIDARWQGEPGCFGSPYICAIGDTVTGGEKGTDGSFEYLVYSNVLVGVAAEVGLKPVLDYGDARLAGLFEPADAGKPLKHFKPHFPGSDRSLETASSLFAAFVFQKTSGAAVAPGAAPAVDPARQQQLLAAAQARLKRPAEPQGSAEVAAAAEGQALKRRRPGLLKPAVQQQQQDQQQQQQQQDQPQEEQQASGAEWEQQQDPAEQSGAEGVSGQQDSAGQAAEGSEGEPSSSEESGSELDAA